MRCIIIGVICVFMSVSCSTDEDKSYELGDDFIENDIQIRVIDTFSIKTGTFKIDSIITSSTNRILLGGVEDDNFGYITSQSYFQVLNSDFSIAPDAVYDSIGFVLNYDTYIYGDSTQVQTYKVHRILETFQPYEGDEFYNTSKLNYDKVSLGGLTFIPRPNTDSLYIPMSDVLGEDVFNKISENEINNSDDFLQYFKGLTIIPDTLSNSHILGFNSSTVINANGNSSMRLYYTVDDGDDEDNDYYIDFVVSASGNQFNAIKSDVRGTVIDSVQNTETIISSMTNDMIYSQAGTGISSRIEISSIKKLNEISDVGTTLSAELTFKPFIGSYDDNNPLKDSLSVYIIDNKNRIINQLTDLDGTTSYAIIHENEEFDSETYYSIQLGGFVDEILNSTYDLNYALMIQFINSDKTVNSTIIQNDEMKLSVNYLNY